MVSRGCWVTRWPRRSGVGRWPRRSRRRSRRRSSCRRRIEPPRSEQADLDELGEGQRYQGKRNHEVPVAENVARDAGVPGPWQQLANTAQDDASAERCPGQATAAFLVGLISLDLAFEHAVLALEVLNPRRCRGSVSHDTNRSVRRSVRRQVARRCPARCPATVAKGGRQVTRSSLFNRCIRTIQQIRTITSTSVRSLVRSLGTPLA